MSESWIPYVFLEGTYIVGRIGFLLSTKLIELEVVFVLIGFNTVIWDEGFNSEILIDSWALMIWTGYFVTGWDDSTILTGSATLVDSGTPSVFTFLMLIFLATGSKVNYTYDLLEPAT